MSDREQMLLDMGLNPDEFAESKIDPVLFNLAPWPNTFKDVDYPCVPCAMCGHLCRWLVGFIHTPSDNMIYVGEDCADYLDSENVVEKQMKMFKTKVANEKKQQEALAAYHQRREEFMSDEPEVVAYLVLTADREMQWREDKSVKAPLPFMNEMVHAFNKYGSLTEGQTKAVKKIMAVEAEFEARKAEDAPEVPLLGGKRLCEGEVVTTKWQDGYYGTVKKMLVKLLDGNKVWGTVPKSIANVERGQKVSFFANVEVSKDDRHFGFYHHPSKAVIERV